MFSYLMLRRMNVSPDLKICQLGQGCRTFPKAHAQIVKNFKEIFSCAHVRFADQNKVLESSLLITNYLLTYLLHGAESFLRS